MRLQVFTTAASIVFIVVWLVYLRLELAKTNAELVKTNAELAKINAEPRSKHANSTSARESIRSLQFSRCRAPPDAAALARLREVLVISPPNALRTYNRSIVPAANAYIHMRWSCKNHTSGTVFSRPVLQPHKLSSCRGDLEKHAKHSGLLHPQCRVPGTTMYVPCHVANERPITTGRFCDGAENNDKGQGQIRVSEALLREAVDLPRIDVAMPEVAIHPDNINHYARDLLFLTALARHARLLGWKTSTSRPSVLGFQPASCRRASTLPVMKAYRESHVRISSSQAKGQAHPVGDQRARRARGGGAH